MPERLFKKKYNDENCINYLLVIQQRILMFVNNKYTTQKIAMKLGTTYQTCYNNIKILESYGILTRVNKIVWLTWKGEKIKDLLYKIDIVIKEK